MCCNHEARDRVSAACPQSKFKDDRHEWTYLMSQDSLMCRIGPTYSLKQCTACRLTVLLKEDERGSYNEAPRRTDEIIYAFYPGKPCSTTTNTCNS